MMSQHPHHGAKVMAATRTSLIMVLSRPVALHDLTCRASELPNQSGGSKIYFDLRAKAHLGHFTSNG